MNGLSTWRSLVLLRHLKLWESFIRYWSSKYHHYRPKDEYFHVMKYKVLSLLFSWAPVLDMVGSCCERNPKRKSTGNILWHEGSMHTSGISKVKKEEIRARFPEETKFLVGIDSLSETGSLAEWWIVLQVSFHLFQGKADPSLMMLISLKITTSLLSAFSLPVTLTFLYFGLSKLHFIFLYGWLALFHCRPA